MVLSLGIGDILPDEVEWLIIGVLFFFVLAAIVGRRGGKKK